MTPDPIPGTREFFPAVLVTRGDVVTACEMILEVEPGYELDDETREKVMALEDPCMEEIALAMQSELSGMFYDALTRAAQPLLKEYGVIE